MVYEGEDYSPFSRHCPTSVKVPSSTLWRSDSRARGVVAELETENDRGKKMSLLAHEHLCSSEEFNYFNLVIKVFFSKINENDKVTHLKNLNKPQAVYIKRKISIP